ncbi:MAG: UDP-N-acetylmuramate dehydrogenase [Verrucomicrobia bacterium]|nr:MAG: UDP-N-acetylmuramate dehydrogenase [Verrucomicrobiota bacterium]
MNVPALRAAQCVVSEGDCLSRHTTFQLGGPCRVLITCSTPAQLAAAVNELQRAGEEFILIGGGSNLLVSDEGVPQVVIRYFSAQPQIQRADTVVEVSGSTLLDDLAAFTVAQGLAGLVYASGIPGTVGGALAGNAGAFGRQIGDVVENVTVMNHAGQTHTATPAELQFAYRRSVLQHNDEMVVVARLRLVTAEQGGLAQQRAECLQLRRQKHPDWRVLPTAGSFFKNIEPTSAAGRRQATGWFLEQAGALRMRVRGARPFEKHANIIVRDGDCTAQDVLELSRQMAAAVEQKFHLQLEREVRLRGRFR